MQAVEGWLRLHLGEMEDWADSCGFGFSQSRTVCVHFCRGGSLHPGPYLVLCDSPVPVSGETGFLGVLLDLGLTFVPLIRA